MRLNGNKVYSTNSDGTFRFKAREGDLLVILHEDFETVFHDIDTDDYIIILVENEVTPYRKQQQRRLNFTQSLDSAQFYLKKDVDKSIQFISEALTNTTSLTDNARTYETLGDIYSYWKQYDLAIPNFKISLQNQASTNVSLKLAKMYMLNGDLALSLSIYNSIDEKSLSNTERIKLLEGIGDTYLKDNKPEAAISSYSKGLKIAEDNKIKSIETDLNSKIAQSYNFRGNVSEAKEYFDNSLELASKQNKRRALEEKVTVADFQNTNKDYEEEIELRKAAVSDLEDIESDTIIDNLSPLTPQKQNYKIGNAYALKGDLKNAIPYLEKSISIADEREDLVVKKDATKKLSDVFRDAGNLDKAIEKYEAYTSIVDELYVKKEQELSQAERFNRKMTESAVRIASLESARKLSQSNYELSLERNKNQRIIIYSLIGGLVLLLVSGYFMFGYIKQQRFANNLLALKSLRSQMNPHFIFNALNSVNSFIVSNDERTANKYLTDFSFLMRTVLENSEEDFIPFTKEIELIKLYTKLEHFRFKDKFDYNINIDSSIHLEDFKIPPMLLQPYIENAVWHGLRYKEDFGLLDISISKIDNDTITISITDNGIGRQKSQLMKTKNQKKHKSTGMNNINKRIGILNEMYRDKVNIEVGDYNEEDLDVGTKVVVTLKKY